VKLKSGEVVFFSWITFKTKADREKSGKIMADPKLAAYMDPSKMPFDGKRMFGADSNLS